MGLRSFRVYHRIFAHDASPGGSGGRIVPFGGLDAKAVVPESTLHALDQLLESITPEGDVTAFAVQRSLIPEAMGSFACLIVCHPFHRDGIERPASVTHARIVRVDSAEAWLDVEALIRLADGFSADVLRGPLEGDFARFLNENESAIDIAGWNPARFEDVQRPFARYVVSACLSRWSRSEAVFHVEPREPIELLSDIAAAWSVLPLYAQLVCPFSLNTQRGARVKALFSIVSQGSEGDVSDNLKQWSAAYVDWVHDRPDDVRVLTESRVIRDLKTLESQFEALTADTRGVESSPRRTGEVAMSKQRRPAAPERSFRRGGLDQDVVAAINREVRSAEESLRSYVDKRVGAAGAGRRMAGSRDGGGDTASSHSLGGDGRRWLPWVQPIAAAVIVLILIAGLVYVVELERARDARLGALEKRLASLEPANAPASLGQPAAAPNEPVTEHRPPTPVTELPGDGWASRFQGLSDHDPQRLGSIVNAVINGGEQSAMPPETAKPLAKIRGLLAAGTKLEKTDRALLRTLLLQCIADQAARQDDPIVVFDGKFDGIPKLLLKRVKDQLHVSSKPGNKEQTADFESEVILRWAQEKRF